MHCYFRDAVEVLRLDFRSVFVELLGLRKGESFTQSKLARHSIRRSLRFQKWFWCRREKGCAIMGSLKDFVLVVIYFAIVPFVNTASLDLCQVKYGEGVALHTSYKDGNRSCCKSIPCPAGSEAVLCSPNDPTSTTCKPCPPNTYQSYTTNSVDMKYCDAKTTCDVGMKVQDDDSSIKDRQCLCDLEKGYCNPSRNRSMFCQRRSCPTGMELNQDCSCSECLDGYFKDVNGSMPCKLWRNCRDEGRKTVVRGTTTTDAVCSNSTYNSPRGASTKAIVSPTLPEIVFTSDSPLHSMESLLSTSDVDHTALENENPQSWIIIIAIVSGIVVALAVSVLLIVYLKCRNSKCIYAPCNKPDQSPAQPQVNPVPQPNPQPNDHSVEAQDGGYCPEREVLRPLLQDDPGHDRQNQPGSCSDAETENDPAGRQTQVVEHPYGAMTRAMTESLRSHRVTLLNSLVISTELLSLLNTNNTITYDMKQAIQSEKTSSSESDRLLDYLMKRPCLSYKTFVFALVCTRQPHLAQLLNAQLAGEYAAYVESGENPEEKVLSFGCL